ncbi:hypothetical protein G4Z16_03995 [Streptomyces bathyalis]|uniref:Uncharacterized protein n=1 Tax=Streptomyces bathyalis TaxID=2710756 RepID=A0A7T1T3G5_9ACTN|nr:hypothetical protein [Streptomyces bathyalis]QPP05692.1 hypothetical protein G4Z16_03995 [Streptomyces bathyalis]
MGRWETELLHQEQVGRPVRESADLLAVLGGDRIVADGEHVARLGCDGNPKWRRGYGSRPRSGHISGDRLLVLSDSFDYHAWGHLGPALLLDPDDGRLVAELRGERAASLGGGRFVLGLEGYDVFDTWLHERDGSQSGTWRSYGHYVPDPDGTIRVVECDRRTPTSSRVVRLLKDGGIERGTRLSGGQVPPPVVLADGTLVVLDAGVLRAVGRDLDDSILAELLPVPPGETWRFRGELALSGDRLTVTVEERHAGEATGSTRRRWTLRVSRRP